MTISDFEPKHLWQQFDKIRTIPRPSKHEEKIREYLLAFAKERNLEAKTDSAGNVVVRAPATPGHEKAPTVVLQSHMDMVCEKNKDVDFDFMTDALQLQMDGDWLKAKGTTLGADNGIGMAAALAMVDDEDVVHGPLEILATVDEETGLTGASQLDSTVLEGKLLLNLDTEELGAVYIGCAGGGDSTITLPITTKPIPSDAQAIHVKVLGLRGGHSGMDIVEQRGNAIKALARILWKAGRAHTINLVNFNGGGVHNAIPREAAADIVVGESGVETIKSVIAEQSNAIKSELAKVDPGFKVEVHPSEDTPAEMMDEKSHSTVLDLILAVPHGVVGMSFDVPGLVETSNNLASVWTRDHTIVVGTSSRSSVGSALQEVRDRIRAAGQLAGATVEENEAYPGWIPNMESKLLELTRVVYEKVFSKQPELKAVHAGLECGIIGEKFPGMDMVSFGPDIEAPHSPDERVNVPSVEKFYTFLKALMKELT